MNSAWAGVAVGAIAAIPAYIGIGAAWVKAEAADGRAGRAEERAEGALEAYQRMADALDRIADGRVLLDPGLPAIRSTDSAVSFIVEWRRGDLYTLRNLGPGVATALTIVSEGLPIARNLPVNIELSPLQSHEFILTGVFGKGIPSELEVTCDELEGSVFVPIPARF